MRYTVEKRSGDDNPTEGAYHMGRQADRQAFGCVAMWAVCKAALWAGG
jgi:hypothetical protein